MFHGKWPYSSKPSITQYHSCQLQRRDWLSSSHSVMRSQVPPPNLYLVSRDSLYQNTSTALVFITYNGLDCKPLLVLLWNKRPGSVLFSKNCREPGRKVLSPMLSNCRKTKASWLVLKFRLGCRNQNLIFSTSGFCKYAQWDLVGLKPDKWDMVSTAISHWQLVSLKYSWLHFFRSMVENECNIDIPLVV